MRCYLDQIQVEGLSTAKRLSDAHYAQLFPSRTDNANLGDAYAVVQPGFRGYRLSLPKRRSVINLPVTLRRGNALVTPGPNKATTLPRGCE